MLREDPSIAGFYVDSLQEGSIAGPAHMHAVFHVIANALGKHPAEIDFMRLDPRDAVCAFIPKNQQESFDWDAFEAKRRSYLYMNEEDSEVTFPEP